MNSRHPGDDLSAGLRFNHGLQPQDRPSQDRQCRKCDSPDSRSARHVGFRLSSNLRRKHDALERTIQEKSRTLPWGFCICAYAQGIYTLDIAKCDIKIAWWPP